jgi:two-component system, cell cycle sensor histidine kinase and response regulator CckA
LRKRWGESHLLSGCHTMMTENSLTEAIRGQWSFFERAVGNYSLILRLLNLLEEGEDFVAVSPGLFVEETGFDGCRIVIDGDSGRHTSSSPETGIDDWPDGGRAGAFDENLAAPALVEGPDGASRVYVYPLRDGATPIGFLLLKKSDGDVGEKLLRELEIIGKVFNVALLLSKRGGSSSGGDRRENGCESLMWSLPYPVMVIDEGGRICFTNGSAQRELAEAQGELLGRKIEDFIAGSEAASPTSGLSADGEVRWRTSQGLRAYSMESFPIKGAETRRGLVLRDVLATRIEEEEKALRKQTESMGMLAGGIAHDFNNLLTAILGYASLMKGLAPEDGELRRYAQSIEGAAQRAATLTKHLLNFSRRQRRASGLVDLNALVDDVLFLMKESARDLVVEKKLAIQLPVVKGDEAELQNAFLNLMMNARDAMHGKGRLRVVTERRGEAGGKQWASVTVEDSGEGIDETIREKIFQPFFSTKAEEADRHLGLGLYLVEKTVKTHGGAIEVESERGRGTRFTVHLPASHGGPKPPLPVQERVASRLATMRVLVVDDEEFVRDILVRVLTDAVGSVVAVADGEEAIRLCEDARERIDLVILDMVMPAMRGDEVLRVIRKTRRNLKVVISSGFMSEDQRERLMELKVDGFLDKPFRNADILKTVRAALGV